MSERMLNTTFDVQRVLARVEIGATLAKLGCRWEVETVAPETGGWLVRLHFQRPDRATGELGEGTGRPWYVAEGTSESSLVKSAFLAVEQVLKHELMEAFRYDGVRLFDPHHSISDLRFAAVHSATSGR